MQSTATNYKLIKKIKDDRFDEEKLHHYRLLVQLGVRDLQVAVTDSHDNRMLLLEDYVLSDLNSHAELFLLLKDIFDSHPLLQAGFWKEVKFSVKNNKFVQVPSSLFIEEGKEDYLTFNAQLDPATEEVLFCKNSRTEAITVFAVYKELYNWLRQLYANTNISFYHQSAALIEGVLDYAQTNPNESLYIFIDRFKLHVLSAQSGKLIYYNQFIVKQFSDYIKYIMLVLKGLNMNQSSSRIILWGYLGKSSPHYQEFIKYIRNVSFGGRNAHLKFGYFFDEIQEHHFFDISSLDLLINA